MSNQKTVTIDARHKFTDAERVELSEKMARFTSLKREAEDNKKASAAQYKYEIEQLESQINSICGKINEGYEMRSTKCHVEMDFDMRLKRYYSVQTGDLVDERAMNDNDLQQDLPMEETDV